MEIIFKEAPLAPAKTWIIYDRVLVEPYGEHTDLSTLMRINFFSARLKGMWSYSFTLVKPTGEEVPIGCNDGTGLQLQNYFTLIFVILDILKTHNPNLKIHIGGIYYLRAFIGIIFLGFGLYWLKNLLEEMNNGIPSYIDIGDRWIMVLLVVIFILIGAFLFFPNIPWTKKTALTPSEFEEWLRNELRETFEK